MARTWLSIRVDLVSGRGEDYWPRPGRIFAAARSHKFSQLADAIDTAFARWDRSHLYKFEMADGPLIGQVEFDDFDLGFIDGAATRLSTSSLGEQFVYEFDFGDSWTHLCTVRPARIDPESEFGIVPRAPLPYWGSGTPRPRDCGPHHGCSGGRSVKPGFGGPGLSPALGRRPGIGEGVVFVGRYQYVHSASMWCDGVRTAVDAPVSRAGWRRCCARAPPPRRHAARWLRLRNVGATISACLSRCTETNPTPSSSLATTTASTSSRVAS